MRPLAVMMACRLTRVESLLVFLNDVRLSLNYTFQIFHAFSKLHVLGSAVSIVVCASVRRSGS